MSAVTALFSGLNEKFGIKDQIRFTEGPGGLPLAALENSFGSASVSAHGAHIMSWRPAGQEPVLWMSAASWFETGRPIRGGVPLCWPWFGSHPSGKAMPGHGFARLSGWSVTGTEACGDGSLRINLSLEQNTDTLGMWPRKFTLDLALTLSRTLSYELRVTNTDSERFDFTAALHTYFNVSDVSKISVTGLEDTEFIDTLDNTVHRQEGPVTIFAETDRVYTGTDADCVIHDPGFGRKIRVSKKGSLSTVVWNPWEAKSKRMPDFGDTEYHRMLCVETANTAFDKVAIEPGEAQSLSAELSVG
jgi:glucose-6-phosphate 1-epimerase